MAASIGKTKHDILEAAHYSGVSTIDRLIRGDGSMLAAIAAKKVLKGWGLDVSKLPPLDETGSDESIEDWEREWAELGKQLHRLASEERYEVEVARIRKVIEAHELVAEGTGAHRRT